MIVRDPIHGDIELTRDEQSILDTAVVQRLRAIKQLGTASLVYPGSTHTRFEHSLGTLFTAKRILDALRRNGYRVSKDEARSIRVAALVHDVTHIPFGHTFEDERKVFARHDTPQRMRFFLHEGELGEVLRHVGVAEDVLDLLIHPRDWRGQVVSGAFDADLLDYLRRDAYYTGLSHNYDDRIYSYFCVESGQLAVDLTKDGLERHDARSEIIHLLRLRYFLTERVYFHHAKVVSGAMISKALELATEHGLVEEALYDKGDETLLELFAEIARRHGNARISELVHGVRARRLYKRAYALTYDTTATEVREHLVETYHASMEARRRLEEHIAEHAGVSPGSVILYCSDRTALKEASVLARLPGGARRLNEGSRRHLDLDALEEQYKRLWRFWVFAQPYDAERVGRAAELILDVPNALVRRS